MPRIGKRLGRQERRSSSPQQGSDGDSPTTAGGEGHEGGEGGIGGPGDGVEFHSDVSGQEQELAARRAEIARMEERALRERESLAAQRADLERRTEALEDRERTLANEREELKRSRQALRVELENVAGLSAEQAKQMLLAEVEHEARQQAGQRLRQIEEHTREEAERRARSVISISIARLAAQHAKEMTVRTVELPRDEMKGRIIGRDGRNIRAFERLTGVDLIIDETPGAVMISSFDGVRREVARLTLERLVADGRINPSTIEEAHERAGEEVEATIRRRGEEAALDAGVGELAPELVELLGRLGFRTSYGQNVLDHLIETSRLAVVMARELGADVETVRRAALLHDLGKGVTGEVEGSHAVVGARFARRHGESEAVAHAIEAHHQDVEMRTVEAVLVQAADALSGARPGARGDSLEQYVGRMRELEEIASRPASVERALAMRAGREVRLMVDPGEVDDAEAAQVAHQVARAIEQEVERPGRIKVTVIRETRATEYAG